MTTNESCCDFSMAGDLGLGMGLKPGGLSNGQGQQDTRSQSSCSGGRIDRKLSRSSSTRSNASEWYRFLRKKSMADLLVNKDNVRFRSNSYCEARNPDIENRTRSYGFIRKLRKRFSANLMDKRQAAVNSDTGVSNLNTEGDKLAEAQQTIISLQGKLDIYKELLYGKYKASEVLLNQLLGSLQEHQEFEDRFENETKNSQKQMNALQFQLELSEGNLTDAQRVWLDRFNDLIKENTELNGKLQTQNETLRKLCRRNSVLKRENEELLSLQDAKEKLLYTRSNSEDSSNDNASIAMELAILGACKCRDQKQEPCPCAKAAAAKQRNLMQLQNTMEEFQREKDECSRLAQLYRTAFEEQIKRNRILTQGILVKECNNELFPKSRRASDILRSQRGDRSEAVNALVDLVCDRTDALIQQQLATKALSQRLAELENP